MIPGPDLAPVLVMASALAFVGLMALAARGGPSRW
jgi:hypothetical protein